MKRTQMPKLGIEFAMKRWQIIGRKHEIENFFFLLESSTLTRTFELEAHVFPVENLNMNMGMLTHVINENNRIKIIFGI